MAVTNEDLTNTINEKTTENPIVTANNKSAGVMAEDSSGGFDVAESVKKTSGESELNSYLYNSDLQNIFKDYQENVSTLGADKQTELQDAYFTREMSKKYLGEYASNTGIGNVSGNLLDIYSNYQSNKTDIKNNYQELSTNLNQTYRDTKATAFNEKMKAQFNTTLADYDEAGQNIVYTALEESYGSEYKNSFEYLDAMKASGELSDTYYNQAKTSLRATQYDSIQTNLENKHYGESSTAQEYLDSFDLTTTEKDTLQGVLDSVDSDSKATDVIANLANKNYGDGVDGLDYLNENRELIGEEAYLKAKISLNADIQTEAFSTENYNDSGLTKEEYIKQFEGKLGSEDIKTLTKLITDYDADVKDATINPNIGNSTDKDYIGDDYNFSANVDGENVDSSSYMYQDSKGNRSFAVKDASNEEGDTGWTAGLEELSEKYESENGVAPSSGDEVDYIATKTDGDAKDKTFTYVYQNGQWNRLVKENPIDNNPEQMATWKVDGESDGTWELYRTTGKSDKDRFVFKGTEYIETSNQVDITTDDGNAIWHLFQEYHTGNDSGATNESVVYYKNNFYEWIDGKAVEMTKK